MSENTSPNERRDSFKKMIERFKQNPSAKKDFFKHDRETGPVTGYDLSTGRDKSVKTTIKNGVIIDIEEGKK